MMLLKDFVNLIDSEKSNDSVLYVYYKSKYMMGDSYGFYDMRSKSDIDKAIAEYGEFEIESFHCGNIKTQSNENKTSLEVIVSGCDTPEKKEEEDTIPDNTHTNVIIIRRSNSDDVVIKTNNKKITLSEDGKDIIISEIEVIDNES